ncbi:MAG: monomethylamine:corrinoid methyltransferase [Anaerolineae bacterium]
MPPYKMWQIMERSQTGPFCEDDDFVYEIFMPKISELVEKYQITYDPEHPVPDDDGLADRVWQAAVELFLDVGVLNVITHRRILLDQAEVREALYHAPGRYWVGDGRDARLWEHREVEDTKPPFCIFSPDITCDEELFLPMSLAYIQEPLADGVCAPILEDTMGLKIKSGAPTEMAGVVEHAMSLREAARLAGRPGLFLVAVGTAQSDAGQIAVSNDTWGVRHTDARLIGLLTELKIDNGLLNKIVHCMQFGCFIGCLSGAIYGGLAGRAEGTAILETAYHLVGLTIYQAAFQQSFPFHLHFTSNSGREMLWLVSVTHQAVSRNSRILTTSNGFLNAGSGTEMVLYEAAAHGLASTVSGGDLWEAAVAHNKYRNYATPLEARLACEVGHSVARQGMTRAQANEIVLHLLGKYEEQIPEAPKGKPFQACYDAKTARPDDWYLDMYKRVKDEVAELGVQFPY